MLAAAVRRSTRANLVHWAEAALRDPGGRVPPNLGPEALAVARDLVRRGLDADALHGYRVGQNVAWRRWMALAFELTDDPGELRELLDVTAPFDLHLRRRDARRHRRADRARARRADRGAPTPSGSRSCRCILEGAPIGVERASARLGYALDRAHTAAIVWSDRPDVEPSVLEEAAEAVGRAGRRAAAHRRPERLGAVGLGGRPGRAGRSAPSGPRSPRARPCASRSGRPAAASPASGAATSTRCATQRLMHRTSVPPAVASYDDVQVVALATQDEERADEFVTRTLGDFAAAPRGAARDGARVPARAVERHADGAACSSPTATRCSTRLARMEQLLPAPLEGRGLQVALALEILRWRGAGE